MGYTLLRHFATTTSFSFSKTVNKLFEYFFLTGDIYQDQIFLSKNIAEVFARKCCSRPC